MWWVWASLAVLLLMAYVTWLAGRVRRLHRRAEVARGALEAKLLRRAAAAAVLADQLADDRSQIAEDLYAAARAALDADPADREVAENDLTRALRELPELGPRAPAWPEVVTAGRRVGIARQVHTDLVRDALAVRALVPVRLLRLASRYEEPTYFDVYDPGLDPAGARTLPYVGS